MAASLPQKPGMMAGMPPQQQQQQQPHLATGAASAAGQQQQQSMPPQGALREISPVFLCRIGQETVQDIVTRTMEIFQITRATQVLHIAKDNVSPPSLCEMLLWCESMLVLQTSSQTTSYFEGSTIIVMHHHVAYI